jgi:hypothetical protein
MLYLGLGPDDEYDDYDAVDEHRAAPARSGGGSASRYPAGPAPSRDLERDLEPGLKIFYDLLNVLRPSV